MLNKFKKEKCSSIMTSRRYELTMNNGIKSSNKTAERIRMCAIRLMESYGYSKIAITFDKEQHKERHLVEFFRNSKATEE